MSIGIVGITDKHQVCGACLKVFYGYEYLLVPVKGASVFVLRKRGNGKDGFTPFESVCDQVKQFRGTVSGNHVLWLQVVEPGNFPYE